LKLVREENVVPAGKVNTLERDLNGVAKAFEEAVKVRFTFGVSLFAC
jgi:hypothetical protein